MLRDAKHVPAIGTKLWQLTAVSMLAVAALLAAGLRSPSGWSLAQAADPPAKTRVVDQIEHRFVPHVLGMRSGQVFETRQQYIERDADGWTALHQPFQSLWNALVERQDQLGFAIVTNKNRAATERKSLTADSPR